MSSLDTRTKHDKGKVPQSEQGEVQKPENKVLGFDPETLAGWEAYVTQNFYGRQFNRETPLPHNEFQSLIRTFRTICHQLKSRGEDEIRVLDHGCADGSRFLGAYFKMARIARQEFGLNFKLAAYDVVPACTDKFIESLTRKNGWLSFTELAKEKDGRKRVFTRDNMKISVVCGQTNDSLEDTKLLLQNGSATHHLVMSNYGPVAHIPHRSDRQDILGILNDLCSHHFLYSVPGPGRFKKEAAEHLELIKDGRPHGHAEEPGDLYYPCPAAPEHKIFYHPMTEDEIAQDLRAAGFKNAQVSIMTMLPPKLLSWHPYLAKFDSWVSRTLSNNLYELPKWLLDQTSYFIAHCDKQPATSVDLDQSWRSPRNTSGTHNRS